MSGFFQQFLGGVKQGFVGNPNLRDFTHGSKTFTTNGFGNAPKFKWLFHVYFDINKTYVTNNVSQIFPDTTNYGILVKNIQLPKFNIALSEMNQYNRKRYVQTKINYDPINITFHDDNLNQIKNLWTAYYNYYYWDASGGGAAAVATQPGQVASKLNMTNIYDTDISSDQNWGYNGLPSNTNASSQVGTAKGPFFKSIRIYGFNQHNYAGYELINPVIESFQHDTYNYYETNAPMENNMTIRYESVNYYQGALNGTKPEATVDGFANPAVYDRRTSPITAPGTNASIMGQNGLLDAASNIYDNLARGDLRGALGAAQTAYRTAQTFKNKDALLNAAKKDVAQGLQSASRNLTIPNIPAYGAGSGAGAQQTRATNIPAGQSVAPNVKN